MRLVALSLLAFIGLAYADIIIAPSSTWTFYSNETSTLTQTFSVVNTYNHSINVTITPSGQVGGWITINPAGVFTITQNNIETFTATASIPQGQASGTYSGQIQVLDVTDNWAKSITVSGIVYGNEFKNTKTYVVQQGQSLNVSPLGYTIIVTSVTDLVKFDLQIGGVTLQKGWFLSEGETFEEEDDIRITATKVYPASKVAKLTIAAKVPITVTLSEASTTSMNICKLQPSWTSRKWFIEAGKTLTDTSISIRNVCDAPIDLKTIDFDNQGSNDAKVEWRIPTQGTKILQPQEDFPITIQIDASTAMDGISTNNLIIMGYWQNTPVSVSIPLSVSVEVTSASIQGSPPEYVIPNIVKAGQDFTIEVRNVFNSDTITPTTNPPFGFLCDQGSKHTTNGIYSVKCKFNQGGIYSLYLTIYRRGVPIANSDLFKIYVVSPGSTLNISLDSPLEVNKTSNIKVVDSLNPSIDLTNITSIQVNGITQTSIVPRKGVIYSVIANLPPYPTASAIFWIELDNMTLMTNPEVIYENDKVSFIANNEQTGEPILELLVQVDGRTVKPPWIAREGTHTITVSAEGYNPINLTVDVSNAPTIDFITSDPRVATINVGDTVQAVLSESANWRVVRYSSPAEVIAEGSTPKILFKVEKPGNYSIQLEGGKELVKFEVQGGGGLFGSPLTNSLFGGGDLATVGILFILGILIVGGLLLLVFKLKDESRKPSGIDLQWGSPPPQLKQQPPAQPQPQQQ